MEWEGVGRRERFFGDGDAPMGGGGGEGGGWPTDRVYLA